MKLRRVFTAIISLIYVAFLVLCCYSGPVSENGAPLSVIGTPQVTLASGSYPADTVDLVAVLQSGETALLDSFTGLQSADLSGSSCYGEIAQWAKEHPQVSLRYTLSFPNGTTVDNSAQTLDLNGLDSASVSQAAEMLACLPQLKSVDLGMAEGDSALSAQELDILRSACPQAELTYEFNFLGRSISLSDSAVDFTGLQQSQVGQAVSILSCLPELNSVTLGAQADGVGFNWEDIGLMQAACPQAAFDYSFNLWGKTVNLKDETLDLNHISMDDEGAAVRAVLPYMSKCTFLDMDFCNVSNDSMASIRDDFPNIKVVWRIWFGSSYSVRTDVEKILASTPTQGGTVDNAQAAVLKYCTDIKYLDLGHNNAISDISFVYSMPNLEVLVIAMNPLSDITPLASCPKLEYIELNSTSVSDLSPLSGLTELRHLNLGNCPNVADISPLYGLTELERLWLGCVDPVPAEQVAQMQAAAPDCRIDTETLDPTQGGWRYADLTDKGWETWVKYGYFDFDLHPRYELLREQFGYAEMAYSFSWLDPLY